MEAAGSASESGAQRHSHRSDNEIDEDYSPMGVLRSSIKYHEELPDDELLARSLMETVLERIDALPTESDEVSFDADAVRFHVVSDVCIASTGLLDGPSIRFPLIRACCRFLGIKPASTMEGSRGLILDHLTAAGRWVIRGRAETQARYDGVNLASARRHPGSGVLTPEMKAAFFDGGEASGLPQRFCRQCYFPCANSRRSFCSDACLHLYKIRSDATYARKAVLLRDRGVCAICGLDCELLRAAVHRWMRATGAKGVRGLEQAASALPLLPRPITVHAFKRGRGGLVRRGYFWHADHRTPVSRGGGNCDLRNLRTLCVPCHRGVTAELRAAKPIRRSSPRTIRRRSAKNVKAAGDADCAAGDVNMNDAVQTEELDGRKTFGEKSGIAQRSPPYDASLDAGSGRSNSEWNSGTVRATAAHDACVARTSVRPAGTAALRRRDKPLPLSERSAMSGGASPEEFCTVAGSSGEKGQRWKRDGPLAKDTSATVNTGSNPAASTLISLPGCIDIDQPQFEDAQVSHSRLPSFRERLAARRVHTDVLDFDLQTLLLDNALES